MTIEIIGRACVAPGANSVGELRDILSEGRCTVTSIPSDRWEKARFWHPSQGVPGKTYTFAAGVLDSIYAFDPAVFGLSQREAMQMDPQQRVLLSLVWQALEDANLPVGSLTREHVGVYIGASSLESGNLASEDPASGSPYFMTGNTLSIVSNRISHIFGLKGPSMTIDTACSSSLVALDQAVLALENGDIDTAIVGGVNLLVHPLSFVGFAQARMLSPEGLCRAYDTNGHGYVRAEGGVAFVLRRTDRAQREGDRSRSRLHAVAVNSSGRTNGISLPSREAQAELLRSIYEGRNIDVNRLAFIEGHGTGTRVGDPAEVWAIGEVIGKKRRAPVPIGSIKTNIGHTEPVSGLFGLLKAMIALENNFLPASLHIEKVNEDIDFDKLNVRVNTSTIKLLPAKEPRLAGINSFGFGGTNAHVVISDPDPVKAIQASAKTETGLFVASAHTASALSDLLKQYEERLTEVDAKEAALIVSAAAANREALRHRFAVGAKDSDGVRKAIEAYLAGEASAGEVGEAPLSPAKIAFVFSGNGAQWAGMGVDAYRENRQFRQSFQSFSALFEYHLGEKLTDLLVAPDLAGRLADTKIAQPLLFAVQAALSDCLHANGVKPEAVFGHSVGELAAAYAAKALTAAEAVAIVAKRSRYQDVFAGKGKMAAVVLNEEAALNFARARGLNGICVAAMNAPNSVTISGPGDEIQAFRDAARKAQIVAHVLDINYPFHHPIIDDARDAFLADLPAMQAEPANCAFISTVTGDLQDGRGLDAEYWWRNVREPVLFKQACQAALAIGCNLFIEVSPRSILSSYVSETAKAVSASAVVVGTLQRETGLPGRDPVAQAFARAVAHGAPTQSVRGGSKRNAHVDLPALPFEQLELKMPSTTDEVDIFGRNSKHPYLLLGWRTDPNSAHWKNHIDAQLFPDLAEHVVDSRAILPGAGFIEIAVSAAQHYYGTQEVEISNLEIVRPLELRPDRMVELSTLLSPETGHIEIRSRERLSSDDWTVHAVARSRHAAGGMVGTVITAPKGEGGIIVSSDEAYETAERFGLQYGPRFRLLSKAVAYGQTVVEVELKPAAAPAHPYIEYNLNPFSTDAVFHGLVVLFGRLSGGDVGSPYIPVRFGTIHVNGGGKIARAMIEIERFSAYSIKARFQLFDADGNRIATLEDCRFRRTSLRRHHTLASVAFHYESVPASIGAVQDFGKADAAAVFRNIKGKGSDNATLLLDAAIYRACHEIGLRLADHRGVVSARRLPAEPGLRAFLTNCLFILEDAGIATADEGEWVLPQDFTLPPVSELLQEIYREDSGRVAEAVLVNNAYRDALEQLAFGAPSGAEEGPARTANFSEATIDHVLVHSPLAERCFAAVVEGVEKVLASRKGSVRYILETGVMSLALSRRLAQAAAAHGAALIIAEPRENVRRTFELAFEQDVHVLLPECDKLYSQPAADLVVVAGMQSQQLLSGHEEIRSAVRSASANGAMLLFADRAPSAFNDFVFGQTEGWFNGSNSPDFPVGRLGTERQLADVIASLGFSKPSVKEHHSAEGPLVVAAAGSDQRPAKTGADLPVSSRILILSEVSDFNTSLEDGHVIVLDADANAERLEEALDEFDDQPLHLVYLADRVGVRSASTLAQDRLRRLGALAEVISRSREGTVKPRLVVVAPGGAPLAGDQSDEANAGLWAFARVLQNEYEALDVHLLDANPSLATDTMWSAVQELLSASTTNREWHMVDGRLRELRAAAGPFPLSDAMTSSFDAATIRQLASGRVESIAWEACDLPSPEKDEVIITVEATGLNFRDVMWAMGVLPEEALEDGFAGATIGMELAGRVLQVGSAVDDLQPGDRVMGIAPAAFSTHVRVRRDGVTKFPERLSSAAAATVPVAFLTAYYAMVHLGHIEKGETILIHGAAGGVGLAALQIAKLRGATVIATAGTTEKRRFLEALGADQIFDSRSLDFVSRVREVTKGEGVDLVLNSLFSEAMERSIELVKPFGRFLELGKRDYYSDRKIGLRPFRRNISYFGIDADQLLVNVAGVTRKIFAEIGRLFSEGKLTPLPYRAFSHDEIGSAFRLMQNAGHIGKIVVRPPVAGKDKVLVPANETLRFSSNGIFLVAGGIGGFGLAAAEWLVARGASRIALCSRRGMADEETLAAISVWHRKGVHATVHACDITDEAAVSVLLELLRTEGPIKGVIHAAMVLDDALISNLTPERNKPVVDVKVKGAEVLHRLTAKDDLELFLLFSSATTMLGNPGQANYVMANGYLEGLARKRRKAGLPALAVGFGAIADTGFLARNAEVNEILSKRIGKTAMKARDALEQVERYMLSDPGRVDAAAVMIAEIDWNAVQMLPIAKTAFFETIVRAAGNNAASSDGDTLDLEEMIRGKSADEAQQILHKLVAGEIATILRVTEDTITPDKVLKEIGLDSLMAMELGMGFQQKTGFDIPLSGVGDETTVGDVVARLRERVSRQNGEGDEVPQGQNAVVDRLVKSHSVSQQQKAAAH
jgi:acyl transferase domain-containing protein/NADPH:quinone reductase-like Zn-dependent oxidoreductase/acyl carrier protein